MKRFSIGITAISIVLLIATASFADVFKTLAVKRTSTLAGGATVLMLETDENTNAFKWYSVPAGSEDQALAVALTAISLGSKVRVQLPVAGSTVINGIGLDNAN